MEIAGDFESEVRVAVKGLARSEQPPAGLPDRLIGAVELHHPPGSRERITRRRFLPVLSAAAVAAVLAGVTLPLHSPWGSRWRPTHVGVAAPHFSTPTNVPVTGKAPLTAPTGTCGLPRLAGDLTRTNGLVTVNPDPRAVTAIWFPGINAKPCATKLTASGSRVARRLADAIRSAPPWPSGTLYCPADVGRGVRLYFQYADRQPTEVVTVSMSGCPTVSAPDRAPRRLGRLAIDLAGLVPAGSPSPNR